MGKLDKEGEECFIKTGKHMKANGGVIRGMAMGF